MAVFVVKNISYSLLLAIRTTLMSVIVFKRSIAGLHALCETTRTTKLTHRCRNDCVIQLGTCTSLLVSVLGLPAMHV